MHSYSVDDEKRVKVIIYITIASILAELFIVTISNKYIGDKTSALFNVIGFPSVFTLMYNCFDKKLWKTGIGKFVGIKTPNLEGKWNGKYTSSRCDDEGIPYEGIIEFTIKQTWTKILLTSKQAESTSESQMAGLFMHNDGNIKLKYQYMNTPINLSKESMHIHYGFSFLEVNGETLEGGYFNDNQRKSYGVIKYKKIS